MIHHANTCALLLIRFEAGTPAIGEAIGLGAAIDYLSAIGMQKIHDYEVRCIFFPLQGVFLSLSAFSDIILVHEYICHMIFSVSN